MALTFDPHQSSSVQEHGLGEQHFYNGNLYKYVYNASTSAAAKGAPAFPIATVGHMKKNANKLGGAQAEGAWASAVPTLYYGWILVKGTATWLLGNTGTAAGEALYAGADIWDTATIGTHHVQGQAYTDDTTSVFTGYISC